MFRYLLRRLRGLIPLVTIAFVVIGTAQPANAEEGHSATLSQVSCVAGKGTVTVTLTAGATDGEFSILVDNASYGDDVIIPVTAGQSKPVVVSNLNDGTHRIEVVANEVTVLNEPNLVVSCTYTNPAGLIEDLCDGMVGVTASNMPFRDRLNGLQPVTFVVTFVSNVVGGVQKLDSFTLPNSTDGDTTFRTFQLDGPGVVSLTVEGENITPPLDYRHTCIVVEDVVNHPHGNTPKPPVTTLPNTGMSLNKWLGLIGLASLLVGGVMVQTGRGKLFKARA
jgi:LPXTG-motif cell wall-anchored protein